jgi:hypothetical protein
MEEELKVFKRFRLNPDESVYLNKFKCFYNSGKVSVLGTMYVVSNCVCFSSKLNHNTLFGSRTNIKYDMTDIIMVEIDSDKIIGNSLRLHLTNGQIANFSGLGSGLKDAQIIISSMIENS